MSQKVKKIFLLVKKRWYVVVILLAGILFFLNQQRVAQAKKEKDSTYTIERQDLRESLSLSGKVEADEHVILRFQSAGRLAWVGVKEGDTVKKFQSLASLDQRDVKKRLQKSLNDYAKERNDFDQSGDDNQRVGDQQIRENGDRMKRLLEKAQYDLNNSVLDVELTTLSLEYANLWTPIEGIIIRIDTPYPGINITPAQAEFEIVNPKTIYFSFTADQTEVIKLSDGMKAELTFDSYPDEIVPGTLYYISYTPKSGETGTVYEGKIRIENDTFSKYRYGMTGDVSFLISEKKNVVSIPVNYVKTDTKGKYVEKIVKGKTVKTYIKVGQEIEGTYEVLKGLEENDMIRITNTTN